jgi:flagellar basal body-associated protein FliL
MKYTIDKPSRTLIFFQRVLAGLLILITLIILAGTVYALIAKPAKIQTEVPQEQVIDAETDGRIFTGIGRVRAKSAEPESAAVMITISFPYDSDDISFSEELASRVALFRSETNTYFETLTADELRLKTGEEIQRELLVRYNAQLRLGFIDTLYITDFMIID